jgi:osmotically-inducible protein OsmY
MIELPTQQLEDLQTAVDEALWHYTPVRGALWELRAVVAPDGEVEIRGHVRASIIKDGVIAALRTVPGVLRIVDRLVADPELELAVARALAEIPNLPPGAIAVRSHLGKVSLLGRLPDEALRKQVLDVAAAVPGVRGVDDRTH